jgi:hypothetical protein
VRGGRVSSSNSFPQSWGVTHPCSPMTPRPRLEAANEPPPEAQTKQTPSVNKRRTARLTTHIAVYNRNNERRKGSLTSTEAVPAT